MRVVRWVIVLLTVAVCGGQKPRWLAALNIGTQPPELYGRVFQRLGRPRVDHALQLGDCVQQFVDPLAGLCPGHGGGEAGAGPVELFELEQAGFEVVFEGWERGGGHGREYSRFRSETLPE